MACAALLAGCGSTSKPRGGGYYKDDGPGSDIPANILSIPDAVPRIETYARANNRPYEVFGRTYYPLGGKPYSQEGVASWYGRKFHGNRTANGETYDMYSMSAAHTVLPLPSYARVTNLENGKSVVVRVNDRGPFHSGRIIDLSYAAAAKLGLIQHGSGRVRVDAITNDDIRRYAMGASSAPAPVPVVRTSAPATSAAPVITASQRPAQASSAPVPDALAALQGQPPAQADPADSTQPDTPVRTNAAGDLIFLQFGAFSGADNAESLAQRLNTELEGLEGKRVHVESGTNLYRVQIGPYASRTEAVNAAWRIREQTGHEPALAVR